MSDEQNAVAYVSYAYKAEKQESIIMHLTMACKTRGLDLRIDINEVGYGDCFHSFMEEIGKARHVIPILNKRYFESFYCMSELAKVVNHGDFDQRIHPIITDDKMRLDSSDLENKTQAFWDSVVACLKANKKAKHCDVDVPDAATLEGATLITEAIPKLFTGFGKINTLSLTRLRDRQFSPIITRILFPANSQEAVSNARRRKNDDNFLVDVKSEIQAILNRQTSLLKHCKTIIAGNESIDQLSLIDHIYSRVCDNPYDFFEYDFYDAMEATTKHLREQTTDMANFKYDLKALIGWISLFAVKGDWVQKVEKEGFLHDKVVEIPAETEAGGVVAAARVGQYCPSFYAEDNTNELWGEDGINPPIRQVSWSKDKTVDQLIAVIWKAIFPSSNESEPIEKELRQEIDRRRRRQKKNHYIRLFHSTQDVDSKAYLKDAEILMGLQRKLPSLMILLLKKKSGERALIVADDTDLRGSLRSLFLSIDNIR